MPQDIPMDAPMGDVNANPEGAGIGPMGPTPDMTPKVGLTGQMPQDKKAQWSKVKGEFKKVQEAFMGGGASFEEAVDELISSLTQLKSMEAPGLGGLAPKPTLNIPTDQAIPPVQEGLPPEAPTQV